MSKSSFADYRSLFIFSLAHFVVDFACAFLLFRLTALGAIPEEKVFTTYALYNLLAFGLEVGFGACLTERTARIASTLGCVLLMTGVLLGASASRAIGFSGADILSTTPNALSAFALPSELSRLYRLSLLGAVCVGVGNALFHVGGGIDALTRNAGRYWRSGVFLAPGSLGLAFGGLLGKQVNSWSNFDVVSGMVAVCGILIWFCCAYVEKVKPLPSDEKSPVDWKFCSRAFVLVASLVIVFTRSSVGFAAPAVRETSNLIMPSAIAMAFCSFGGKFLGGFLADLFGARRVGALTIFIAIPTLCYCESERVFLLGVFLLNISTALTLVETARSYGGKPGVAFGLTTLVLLSGYFTLFPIRNILDNGAQNSVRLTIVALLSLSVASSLCLGRKKRSARLGDDRND